MDTTAHQEEPVVAEVLWRCNTCGKERTKPEKRLPMSWKRRDEYIYCDVCWNKAYMLRAVTLPIVSPLEMDWKTLNAALVKMWQQTTEASNWIMTELYVRDVRRVGNVKKMPAMARAYLYPEIRERWPELPSQSVAALENTAQAKYRAMRFDVIWTAKQSLSNFRYPTPFPIPASGWSVEIEKEVPVLSVRIGDQRVRLRLKGGFKFRRQLNAIKSMSSGEATTGEMAIYKQGKDTMAKLVAWLPRPSAASKESGTLRVRTAKDCLLIAVNDKDETLWRYNADHLPRLIAAHQRELQRWAEDQKYEQRPVPTFEQRRKLSSIRYNHRIDSICHEVSAHLANYAKRRKFAAVLYDDSEQGFVPKFQYFKLASLIQQKLDAFDIEFAKAATEIQEEQATAAAEAKG